MRLLIIGHINSEVEAAISIAQSKGARVFFSSNIKEALENLRNGQGADLIMIDVSLDIANLIASLKSEHITIDVVAFGINCTPKDAVLAIKAGAKEFIPLPPDEKLIAALLSTILDNSRPMIGNSPAIKAAVNIADKISKSDASVLITGYSGTGKEVMAHYIHNNSNRKDKLFVRVNCAAIPENLLESELFGHEKGAFTGAVARRIGKFEEASGGTLLLDEISEMESRLQAKLLRAIQEKEIDRVGGTHPIKINLRIIATSNRDLLKEIEKGTFREDLYFRLNIVNIELPSLGERKEDLAELAEFFIKKYSASNNIDIKNLSLDAIEIIQNYNWPGNIRELENTMHRAVLLSQGDTIEPSDLMLKSTKFTNKSLDDVERELISNTMKHCLGDSGAAATILGISIARLQERLDTYSKN